MKIVAFLQNPWFKEGTAERHILMYRDDQVFHRKVLQMSMSGGRLWIAFGSELYNQIWWDNTSWRPSVTSSGVKNIDMEHVRKVISEQRPGLVLCFGRQAEHAVNIAFDYPWYERMVCHHPNARGRTQADLDLFALIVKKHIVEAQAPGYVRPESQLRFAP